MKKFIILLCCVISVGYIFAEGKKYEAEGLSFMLPYGFSEVENPIKDKENAPVFAKYYMNEKADLLVRVRKDDWGEGELNDVNLFAYATAYVANAIGYIPKSDALMKMESKDYELMKADGGVLAIFELSKDQEEIQGFKFEILLMLMKKPKSIYLISYQYNDLSDEWDNCGKMLFDNVEIKE
jgi:hypothetical protein